MHLSSLWLGVALLSSSAAPSAPHGRYVEARTATVFAGACHFGAQATTQGRGALLAWHIDAGAYDGIDLTNADIAVVLAASENLADAGVARRSWIYVSDRATPGVQRAALAWLRAQYTGVLGDVVGVYSVPLALALEPERYRVQSAGRFELAGELLPNRACCSMPFNVWYRPFVALDDPVVGCDREFRVSDPALRERWSRPDENAAFVGRFGSSGAASFVR